MTQAGNGSIYLQEIITAEVTRFITGDDTSSSLPIDLVITAHFNPNLQSIWFTSVMQIINNVTILAVLLTGAALIREREHGTISRQHLGTLLAQSRHDHERLRVKEELAQQHCFRSGVGLPPSKRLEVHEQQVRMREAAARRRCRR